MCALHDLCFYRSKFHHDSVLKDENAEERVLVVKTGLTLYKNII